ncbi:hypothetical protein, conserved [Entamoeba histolytica]
MNNTNDSLSPLLFVLSIDILSKQLDKQISKLNIKMNGEEKQVNQINGELAELPRVTNDNHYKYLGIEIGDKININKYCTRILNDVSSILSSLNTMKYSSINTIRKINNDTISKLRY